MTVQYYPTADTGQDQLFNCYTVPQNILTPACRTGAILEIDYFINSVTNIQRK